MSAISATDTVKTFITALQSGDMEVAANKMADDFTMSGFAPKTLNKNEFLVMHSKLLAAMPDLSFNMDEPQEENDEVKALVQITGTNLNDLDLSILGIQPILATGLAVILPQVHVTYHVKDDHVTSVQFESMPGGGIDSLLQQVGAELPLQPRGVNMGD